MFNGTLNTTLLLIIAAILIGIILHYTAAVFIPFAIAIVCLYVFKPATNFLNNTWKMPRFFSVLTILLLFIAISVLIGYTLYSSLRSLISRYAFYEERFRVVLSNITTRYDLDILQNGDFFNSLGLQDAITNLLLALSGGSISFLSGLLLVVIFLLFLLLEEGKFSFNVATALSKEQAQQIIKSIKDINDKVSRYLSTKLVISLCTAAVVFFGFWIIGVDFPFVWAILTFLFNFIPSIGSIIITLLSTIFVIIQFLPNWGPIIVATALISITEITFGNIVEPRLLGRSLNINAVVIVLSLLIWAKIWGVAGMFLSIPMTVVLISILDTIPLTRPISTLLGGGALYDKQSNNTKKTTSDR